VVTLSQRPSTSRLGQGVEWISEGALTYSGVAVDLSLEIKRE